MPLCVARPGAWPTFLHHGPGASGLADPCGDVKVGLQDAGGEPDPDRPRTLDPDALARLQDHVATWLPGHDATRPRPVGATWATPSSGEFVLERRGPLLVAAGLGSRGFAHAPQVGSTLAALATDREPATVGR